VEKAFSEYMSVSAETRLRIGLAPASVAGRSVEKRSLRICQRGTPRDTRDFTP
jgi:hypothetical protein